MQYGNLKARCLSLVILSVLALGAPGAGAQPTPPDGAESMQRAQVNINQADVSTLAEVLEGVGESRAQAIVEYREKYGPFKSVEELREVKGIGESTIRVNRDRILL